MEKPLKISVITATYNSVETLTDCLASLANQNYQHIEHIIIDGASTDGTVEVIQQKLDNVAIFQSERDQGIYDALNKGIDKATGDVVGFLHSDDFYPSSDVLSAIAEAFKDPTVSAVYGDLEYVAKQDTRRIVRRWRSNSYKMSTLEWGWMPAHPTLYVRRDWYETIGGFDITYSISADYLSILQLFSQPQFKSIHLPKVLVKMRIGGTSNKSFKAIIKKSKEDWRALRSIGFSVSKSLLAILGKNFRKLSQFM